MKTLISLFSIVLCLSYGKAQWVELDTGMENPPVFNDVYAITPDIVVVVGANGTIIKTTDGGETWQQKPSGMTTGLGKVQFPTPEIGYITGSGGKLLKTTDGGETWTIIDLGENVILNSLSCVNGDLIFISSTTGGVNQLLKSENGGETWDNSNELPFISDIQFVSNEIGFARNLLSINLSRTENGGGVWNEMEGFAPVHFLDQNIGFYYESGLYKTVNGGSNFELVSEGIWFELEDIYAINENNVWGILAGILDGDGSTRGIIKLTPSSAGSYAEDITWEDNTQVGMSSIHFADETTGYIIGYKQGKATIWKNGTGINTMAVSDTGLNNKIKIYPNPVSSEINIEFKNNYSKNYSVTLTDMTGKKVYTQKFNAKNKIIINVKNFSKGLYILTINNHSQKIIIN